MRVVLSCFFILNVLIKDEKPNSSRHECYTTNVRINKMLQYLHSGKCGQVKTYDSLSNKNKIKVIVTKLYPNLFFFLIKHLLFHCLNQLISWNLSLQKIREVARFRFDYYSRIQFALLRPRSFKDVVENTALNHLLQ